MNKWAHHVCEGLVGLLLAAPQLLAELLQLLGGCGHQLPLRLALLLLALALQQAVWRLPVHPGACPKHTFLQHHIHLGSMCRTACFWYGPVKLTSAPCQKGLTCGGVVVQVPVEQATAVTSQRRPPHLLHGRQLWLCWLGAARLGSRRRCLARRLALPWRVQRVLHHVVQVILFQPQLAQNAQRRHPAAYSCCSAPTGRLRLASLQPKQQARYPLTALLCTRQPQPYQLSDPPIKLVTAPVFDG